MSMLKFPDMPYQRPDVEKLKADYSAATRALAEAADGAAAIAAIQEASRIYSALETTASLCNVRHTLNTEDKFYEDENNFFDETLPVLEEYVVNYYKTILASPHREAIEAEYGHHIFELAELATRSFIPEIIPEMQEDNKLATEYQKLMASCAVEFRGEKRNIYGLTKFLQDPDRQTRKEAFAAWASFFADNEEKFDEIFDKMVKVRHAQAVKMGFENFVPLAYLRRGRIGYTKDDVKKFRDQVREVIVPICSDLYARQAKRIGVEDMKYYDEPFSFRDGNAAPQGDMEQLVAAAGRMYNEMCKETGEFFQSMRDRELLDLDTRPNKAIGGYCTHFADYRAPFIFSNFNGTSADVDVLTHEAGHAFMAYCAGEDAKLPEYIWGSQELDEIHSMSMEFFAYPWMELFFGDKADKYRFSHMADAIIFVPYGVAVDEFQHIIYENPDMTPAQRKAAWSSVEKKYLPHRDFDGMDIMERGAFFFKQLHIFMDPFYYIDYTLASMGAFEFYGKMQQDRDAAFAGYVALCRAGGSDNYLNQIKIPGLRSPFEEGSVAAVLQPLVDTLNAVDDSAL